MSKYKIPQLPTIHIEKTHRFDIYFCAGLKNSHCTRMNSIWLFSFKLYLKGKKIHFFKLCLGVGVQQYRNKQTWYKSDGLIPN